MKTKLKMTLLQLANQVFLANKLSSRIQNTENQATIYSLILFFCAAYTATNKTLECGNTYVNTAGKNSRSKRDATLPSTPPPPISTEIYIETAVFVDKDLYAHMSSTFPVNTEKELIRFVLALINAVSLLKIRRFSSWDILIKRMFFNCAGSPVVSWSFLGVGYKFRS